jgi:hypothetical protein
MDKVQNKPNSSVLNSRRYPGLIFLICIIHFILEIMTKYSDISIKKIIEYQVHIITYIKNIRPRFIAQTPTKFQLCAFIYYSSNTRIIM